MEKTATAPSPEVLPKIVQCAILSVQKEHPNFLDLEIEKPSHYDGHPAHLHPAFFGSFDWHSAVHSHWTISRLLKLDPSLPGAEEGLKLLEQHITKENILVELQSAFSYLQNWEVPYGYSWFFVLMANIRTWNTAAGKKLAKKLRPLECALIGLFDTWMHCLKEPVREGQHENTAFALLLLWIYATATKDVEFQKKISATALRLFSDDEGFTDVKPETCFLSPALCVLHLMSSVMSPKDFSDWVQKRNWAGVMELKPVEGDAKHPYKSHLIGLNFSRCWSFNALAEAIPAAKDMLCGLAMKHYKASLPLVPSGHWEADHWTATYALMAYLSFQKGAASLLY